MGGRWYRGANLPFRSEAERGEFFDKALEVLRRPLRQ